MIHHSLCTRQLHHTSRSSGALSGLLTRVIPSWLKPNSKPETEPAPGSVADVRADLQTLSLRIDEHRASLAALQSSQRDTLGAVRAALKSTISAAERIQKAAPSDMSRFLLDERSNSADLVDFNALKEQFKYSQSLLKSLTKDITLLKAHVDSANTTNSKLWNCVEDLESSLFDLEIVKKRLKEAEKLEAQQKARLASTAQTPSSTASALPDVKPLRTAASKRKRKDNPVFNTPAEDLTDTIIASLASLKILPNPLVSTLNPNAHVFILNTKEAANNFISTVQQISARNNNILNVVGMDVEFWQTEPATIQLAFSAEVVVIFQIYGMCGVTGQPKEPRVNPNSFPRALAAFLESVHVRKTGVAIYSDCLKILTSLNVETKNLADPAKIATSMSVGSRSRSLASIYYSFVDPSTPFKSISKSATGFNWSAPELDTAAIEYAANDALASLLCYRAMVNEPNVATAPWEKNAKSQAAEYNAAEEERNWQEFQSVRDEYNLTAKSPKKLRPGSLPSLQPSESDMMNSFAEIPSDLSFSEAPETEKKPTTHRHKTTVTKIVPKAADENSDSPSSVKAEMIRKYTLQHHQPPFKPTKIQALPLELEQAMFRALLASGDLEKYIKDDKPLYLMAVLKHLVGGIWAATEKYLSPSLPPEKMEKIQAILAIKSPEARRLVAFEVTDMWFKKMYLIDFHRSGPTGVINRKLAIEAPKWEETAKVDMLVSGLEMLSPSTNPDTLYPTSQQQPSSMKSELIQVWNRTNPTSPIKSVVLPMTPEFEVALFKSVVASGDLHGYINQSSPESSCVYAFFLMKAIVNRWNDSEKYLPTSPSSDTLKLLNVKGGLFVKRALAIDAICGLLERGYLSTFTYIDNNIPSITIGSSWNEDALDILKEMGPVEDAEMPQMFLGSKKITDIWEEYDGLDGDKVQEWKLANFKFAADIRRFEILIVAFDRIFGKDEQKWNKFFDESAKWDMVWFVPDGVNASNVEARMKAIGGMDDGKRGNPMSLRRIYRIISRNKLAFDVQ
ncbi:hypothetical protein BCR33DRAFT_847658 [Rhizoclosmatium globosum]|uniref:3'-5' exonuclease n=1 Tax=Rhizoclosmatium globosum TaxID=329046 RepID=A0A1Y2CPW6_9FUNG|nr:hypothetical protein BCR33DRAFT_847658 [Rhizoclosmatium globosum]|eukprot:ORY48966.1 hypothetical protein BCR33DRAFT_847658 [Rhizoclosmatium globosum]